MTKARTLADNFAADINAVTANAPLTGGGTSGTVTVGIQAGTTAQSGAVQLTDSTTSTSTTTAATPNSVKSAFDLANTANSAASSAQTTANAAIAKSTIDAKGDLLVGTANDTVSRLAVASTAGFVLTVDSAEATGLKWAAPAAGGKVLQVVEARYSTQTTVNSTTFTDTGLSATITPSSTASKILVLISQQFYVYRDSVTAGGALRLLRGASEIFTDEGDNGYGTLYGGGAGLTNFVLQTRPFIMLLDSPNTTSATTYKTQQKTFATGSGGSSRTQNESRTSVITLLEIGA